MELLERESLNSFNFGMLVQSLKNEPISSGELEAKGAIKIKLSEV